MTPRDAMRHIFDVFLAESGWELCMRCSVVGRVRRRFVPGPGEWKAKEESDWQCGVGSYVCLLGERRNNGAAVPGSWRAAAPMRNCKGGAVARCRMFWRVAS